MLGFSRAQAESLLRNAHLNPRVRLADGPAGTANTVTSQTPTGGHHVAPDSVVTVDINSGPPQATIPRGLLGRDVDQVGKLLTEAGFTNVTTRASSSTSNTANGTVTALDPPEGQKVPKGQRIAVTYTASTGASTSSSSTSGESNQNGNKGSASKSAPKKPKPSKKPHPKKPNDQGKPSQTN